MNTLNENSQDVIVFDNLRSVSDAFVDDFASVTAKRIEPSEPFMCSNAAGSTRAVESFADIAVIAKESGSKIRAAFGRK